MIISVIIPTYKPQNYIYECLESVCLQTLDKSLFEILLILNGCNEPYYSDLKTFIANRMVGYNVRLFQTDIAGVSNARNIGLENAQGNYIAFIDDDDIVSTNYLKSLYGNASEHYIVVSNVKAFKEMSDAWHLADDYLSVAYKRYNDKSKKSLFLLRSFLSTSCCKLIPMSMIENRRFDVDFSIGEDSIFMAYISDRINEIRFTLPNVVYYRRLRVGSAIRSKRSIADRIHNCLRSWHAYFFIYIKHPFEYNILFFMSRFVAVFIRDILKK